MPFGHNIFLVMGIVLVEKFKFPELITEYNEPYNELKTPSAFFSQITICILQV